LGGGGVYLGGSGEDQQIHGDGGGIMSGATIEDFVGGGVGTHIAILPSLCCLIEFFKYILFVFLFELNVINFNYGTDIGAAADQIHQTCTGYLLGIG
jgi:hypothetical protein